MSCGFERPERPARSTCAMKLTALACWCDTGSPINRTPSCIIHCRTAFLSYEKQEKGEFSKRRTRIPRPLEPYRHGSRRGLLRVAIGLDRPTGLAATHDERHEPFERGQRFAAGITDAAQFPLPVDNRGVCVDATNAAERQRMLGSAIFLTQEERGSIGANRLTSTFRQPVGMHHVAVGRPEQREHGRVAIVPVDREGAREAANRSLVAR